MNINLLESVSQKKLHDLGDKIERIAEKLKSKNIAESEELYRLGNEVEHVLDREESTGSVVREEIITQAQRNSSSTVNSGQASG